jgi:hypothetical protein
VNVACEIFKTNREAVSVTNRVLCTAKQYTSVLYSVNRTSLAVRSWRQRWLLSAMGRWLPKLLCCGMLASKTTLLWDAGPQNYSAVGRPSISLANHCYSIVNVVGLHYSSPWACVCVHVHVSFIVYYINTRQAIFHHLVCRVCVCVCGRCSAITLPHRLLREDWLFSSLSLCVCLSHSGRLASSNPSLYPLNLRFLSLSLSLSQKPFCSTIKGNCHDCLVLHLTGNIHPKPLIPLIYSVRWH